MTNLIESVRTTANAGSGITTLAAATPVSLGYMHEFLQGRRPHTPQLAAALASTIGATPAAVLRENTDLQLAIRRGALN